MAGFRAYCHINEFLHEGYARLPLMIAMCEPAVLWGPSSLLMDSYKDIKINSEMLLKYIEHKPPQVVVAARKNWLTEPQFRNDYARTHSLQWDWTRWTDFDKRLLQIYEEDYHKPRRDRRVLEAPEETGNAYATEEMQNKDSKIVAEVRSMIQRKLLIPGIADKMDAGLTEDLKVHHVLRDLHNHAEARSETDSDLIIFPYDQVHWLYLQAEGEGLTADQEQSSEKGRMEHRQKFFDAGIRILEKIGAFPDISQLDKFLEMNQRQELVNWIDEAIRTTSPMLSLDPDWTLRELLGKMMEKDLFIKKKGWQNWILPQSPLEGALAMAVSLFLLYLGREDPRSWAGLTVDFLPTGKLILERASAKGLSSERYSGVQWPFIATTGQSARFNSVMDILRNLGLLDKKPQRESA